MKNLALLIMFFMGACAFKSSKTIESPVEISKTASIKAARFDWNSEPSNRNFLVKAKRGFVTNGKNSVVTDNVVTLPLSIPNPLSISNDVLPEFVSGFSFAKAHIKTDSNTFELPIQVQFVQSSIVFHIQLFASAISQEKSQNITLTVDVFGLNQKLFSYNYLLRTPPSEVSFEIKNLKEIKNAIGADISSGAVNPKISGDYYTMLGMITVSNREAVPVEMIFPRKMNGSLMQHAVKKTYEDLGCHGGDFKYTVTPRNDLISDEVFIVPYNSDLFSNLSSLRLPENASTPQSIKIDAASRVSLAVYARGEPARQWLDGRAFFGSAQTKHVPAGCYTTRGNCSEGGRGNTICENITARTYQDLVIGEVVDNPFLRVTSNVARFRYLDIDQVTDDGVRDFNFLPNENEIFRAN